MPSICSPSALSAERNLPPSSTQGWRRGEQLLLQKKWATRKYVPATPLRGFRQPKLSNGGVCTRRVQAVASLGYKPKLCLLPRTPFWRTPEWPSLLLRKSGPFGGFAKVPESLALTKSKILCAPRVTGTEFRVSKAQLISLNRGLLCSIPLDFFPEIADLSFQQLGF